jgi:small subunit ribosomal protein S17
MTKKQRVGVIVSNNAFKTVVVSIQIRYQHPKYLKTVIQTKRYLVHDEYNQGKTGDIVIIEESRPLSKRKRWKLKEIIRSY